MERDDDDNKRGNVELPLVSFSFCSLQYPFVLLETHTYMYVPWVPSIITMLFRFVLFRFVSLIHGQFWIEQSEKTSTSEE